MVELFGSIPLEGADAGFAYWNLNYAVAKALIEQVTGAEFTALMRREVLGPAEAGLRFDPAPNVAIGYEGMPGAYEAGRGGTLETYAGGTLWGRAEALAAWEHALDAGRIVAGAWVDTIRTPVSEEYGLGWFLYPGGMLYHGGDGDGFQAVLVRARPRLCWPPG